MKGLFPIFILALFIGLGVFLWNRSFPSAQSLLDEIRKNGSASTFSRLVKEKKLDSILDHIEQGNSEWLQVGLQLRPHADAGFGESFFVVYSRALLNAPQNVLALTPEKLHLKDVCVSQLIGAENQEHRKFIQKTIQAVEAVNDDAVANQKEICLKLLAADLEFYD